MNWKELKNYINNLDYDKQHINLYCCEDEREGKDIYFDISFDCWSYDNKYTPDEIFEILKLINKKDTKIIVELAK